MARWVNTDALSAINITMPLIYLSSALGMMFGSGGNALVAKKLGEGKHREAFNATSRKSLEWKLTVRQRKPLPL